MDQKSRFDAHSTEKAAQLEQGSRSRKKTRYIWIGIALAIAALVALIVPLAVILPRKKHSSSNSPKATVMVPLYIYPSAGAWDPLYDAASRHENLNFLVIVNPDSGPGNETLPNEEYVPQIQKLNTFPNIKTVGYVRTTLATRNISDVLADVATYSSWSTNPTVNGGSASLAMHGIFFDEAPSDYTQATANYLTEINLAVKNASGIHGTRTVIHNPGVIPDTQLRVFNTDIQVILENTYAGYQDQELQTQLAAVSGDRSLFSYMVHTVPDGTNLKGLVDELSRRAGYVFVTDLSVDYYQSFGRKWNDFIDAVSG